MWANTYERDTRDFFALERDVTADIARQIQVQLRTPGQLAPTQPRLVSLKVLEAYLQGTYHINRYGAGGGDEEKKKAAEYFQQAIDADPNFAQAYHGLADSHDLLLLSSRQDTEIKRKAAERALELDPNLTGARMILAGIKWGQWDFRGVEDELRQALVLNPNDGDAHTLLGRVLASMGRPDEGLREAQIAQQLDPTGDHLSGAFYDAGEYDRAIAEIQELAEFHELQRTAVLSSFHYHHARLIEILYCIERLEQLLNDPEILSKHVRAVARPNALEGVGAAEAPRGTLFHHYKIDEQGLIRWVNLIIATGQNNLAMNRSVLQVAKHYLQGNRLTPVMLNRVEAVIRCYDPCLSCSTHALGQMQLRVQLLSPDGEVLDEPAHP